MNGFFGRRRRVVVTLLVTLSISVLAWWIRSLSRVDFFVFTVRDEIEHTLISGNGSLWLHQARYLDPPIDPHFPRWESFPHDAVFAEKPTALPKIRTFRHRDFGHISLPYWSFFLLAIGLLGGFVYRSRKTRIPSNIS